MRWGHKVKGYRGSRVLAVAVVVELWNQVKYFRFVRKIIFSSIRKATKRLKWKIKMSNSQILAAYNAVIVFVIESNVQTDLGVK